MPHGDRSLLNAERVDETLRPVARNPWEGFHVNAQRHALLARRLIEAGGGLEECAAACRLKRSRLAEFSDPKSGSFMPADVMADLEAYCGEPIYSRAIAEDRPARAGFEALVDEACATVEAAANLQQLIRRHRAGEQLGATERLQVERFLDAIEEHVRATRETVERVRP